MCWLWFIVWCLISFSVSFSLSEHIIHMVLFPAISQTRGISIWYSSSYFQDVLEELFRCKAYDAFYIVCTAVKAGSHSFCLGVTLLRKIWRTTVSPFPLKATMSATRALLEVLQNTWWDNATQRHYDSDLNLNEFLSFLYVFLCIQQFDILSLSQLLQCVAPKGPLACARTYFFGSTHVPYLGKCTSGGCF